MLCIRHNGLLGRNLFDSVIGGFVIHSFTTVRSVGPGLFARAWLTPNRDYIPVSGELKV